jgi:hypothetical protein
MVKMAREPEAGLLGTSRRQMAGMPSSHDMYNPGSVEPNRVQLAAFSFLLAEVRTAPPQVASVPRACLPLNAIRYTLIGDRLVLGLRTERLFSGVPRL